MNIQSNYQVIYTVLFVLAAVFFAMAVFVFFRFKIPEVLGDYTGRRGRTARRGRSAVPAKRRLDGNARTENVPRSEAPPMTGEGNTVWLDERQTMDMGCESSFDSGKTEDMTTTNGLTGEATVSLAGANEEARAALAFRSDVKIIVAQSMERI